MKKPHQRLEIERKRLLDFAKRYGIKHEKTIRQSKALDQVIVQLMKAFKQHE